MPLTGGAHEYFGNASEVADYIRIWVFKDFFLWIHSSVVLSQFTSMRESVRH